MRENPFAHFVTSHTGLRSTRLPFIADFEGERVARLRGHFNARNPQAENLDGQDVLVTFDGPASYVSPHWRTDLSRAATFDYEEVQVSGRVRIVADMAFFRRQVDDLAALMEPVYAEVGPYPVWRTAMTPPGYVERLFPAIVAFEIDVQSVSVVSKLHQAFPEADRRRIADHLARSSREQSRAIAEKIRRHLEG
jgi:transcriptional regulator